MLSLGYHLPRRRAWGRSVGFSTCYDVTCRAAGRPPREATGRSRPPPGGGISQGAAEPRHSGHATGPATDRPLPGRGDHNEQPQVPVGSVAVEWSVRNGDMRTHGRHSDAYKCVRFHILAMGGVRLPHISHDRGLSRTPGSAARRIEEILPASSLQCAGGGSQRGRQGTHCFPCLGLREPENREVDWRPTLPPVAGREQHSGFLALSSVISRNTGLNKYPAL